VAQGDSNWTAGVREGDVLAGKYCVERVLGIGGMGGVVVVVAQHIQFHEKVALKFILPEMLGNSEAVTRFVRESRAMMKITSDHVARVTDVGTFPNGAPYMVTEYLEGEDLASWVERRGLLSVELAMEFILQACLAVADAHSVGIVHRDLKPSNLLCIRRPDGDRSIKVLDFGISKALRASVLAPSSVPRASSLLGSPPYMSPEQLRAQADIDARTDVWALGVILFELMAGRPPFVADSVTELTVQVAGERAPAIRGIRPDVPRGLEAAILKCIQKDREDRYPSVAALARDLLPFAPPDAKATVERVAGILAEVDRPAHGTGPPPSLHSAPPPASARTVPPAQRATAVGSFRSAAFAGAGLSVAVVVVAIVGSRIRAHEAKPHRDISYAAASSVPIPSTDSVAASPPPAPLPDETAAAASPQPSGALSASSPSVPPAVSAIVPARSAPPRRPQGAPHAAPRQARPPASSSTPSPAPPKVHCHPPYVIDSEGYRQYKPECL
jgi:eukaryotic-like serine/threonine-protein kinase